MFKKILIVILIILFLAFLIFKKSSSNNFYQIKINGKKYSLLTAKNPQEWQKGLMFYKNKKELNGADGMVFIFPDKDYRTFWNQDTYLDLDIYWLVDGKVVGKDFLPSILKSEEIVTVSSKEKVNQVVEIIRTEP
ncbi:MAG: hypothetical protein KatS3mg092_0282 [Patescibacteria group bacterium]|nr:MAG: hypothetical protein KatS3mg092_0282 [Patescibacteria group bacterium]